MAFIVIIPIPLLATDVSGLGFQVQTPGREIPDLTQPRFHPFPDNTELFPTARL